jgi:aquaporin Z
VEKGTLKAAVAEFVATFAFVFIGAGSVVMAGPSGSGLVGVALAHGLALAIMVSATMHISGGAVNPAVTIGLWVAGKLSSMKAVVYVVAEVAGGMAGALLLRGLVPGEYWKPANLGAPALTPGVGTGKGVLIEAVLTFFLVFVVFATAVDKRGAADRISGLAIGLVLTFDILVGGQLTGAAMNPARAFGPEVALGNFSDWWVYWVGPIAGGVIAAVLYWGVFLRDAEPVTP